MKMTNIKIRRLFLGQNPKISFMTGIYDSNTGNITGIMGIKPVCFGYQGGRDKITGSGVKQA